jgi:RNA polymerase sigma-32 factor
LLDIINSSVDAGCNRASNGAWPSAPLCVTEKDVVDMNRRLGGDASLNAPMRDESESGEWQDWLIDETPGQERVIVWG